MANFSIFCSQGKTSVKPFSKICLECGGFFQSKRREQRYCSRKCVGLSINRIPRRSKKTKILNCEFCKKEFKAFTVVVEKGRRFCNFECFKHSLVKKKEKNADITKQKRKEYLKAYSQTSQCKACQKAYRTSDKGKRYKSKYNKKWKAENKQKIKDYRYKYKKQRAEQRKARRKKDIEYKILGNLRTRLGSALKGKLKKDRTKNFLGCSINELKEHLEFKFQPGMTWENYGKCGWHIDHILPCASFDLSDLDQQKKCFHYTNLQPLWAEDNLKKGDSFPN